MEEELPENLRCRISLNHKPTVRKMLDADVNIQIFRFDQYSWDDYDLVDEIFSRGYEFDFDDLKDSLKVMFCCTDPKMHIKYLNLFAACGYLDGRLDVNVLDAYLSASKNIDLNIVENIVCSTKVKLNEPVLSNIYSKYNKTFPEMINQLKKYTDIDDTEILLLICYKLGNKVIKYEEFAEIVTTLVTNVNTPLFFEKLAMPGVIFWSPEIVSLLISVGLDYVNYPTECLGALIRISPYFNKAVLPFLHNLGFNFAARNNEFVEKSYRCKRIYGGIDYESVSSWLKENGYADNS
jgi:hypothetical protein